MAALCCALAKRTFRLRSVSSALRPLCVSGRRFNDGSGELSSLRSMEIPTPEELDAFVGMRSEFPCLQTTPGPEPQYQKFAKGAKVLHQCKPFHFRYGGVIPELFIAYETWGTMNEDKSNVILIHGGLSASSHAKSSEEDLGDGWWEMFIGPGRPLDTNKFFFVCANNLGGCFGTSGPSTVNPRTGKPYAMTFPLTTIKDIVKTHFIMLDELKIDQCYATIGASAGGMQALLASVMYPERVKRVVALSACLQSAPSSIAFRYLQRQAIMSDPNWNNGDVYQPGGPFPFRGMKNARSLATCTYRSGPEWNLRFGRKRTSNDTPSMCPDFEIESYLDHQGHKFRTMYDPNSLMYISKAMDLFDLSDGYPSMEDALARVNAPVLVVGVQSDILIPVYQQKEMTEMLRKHSKRNVTYYEVDAIYGHDAFLLDLNSIGTAIKGFMEIGNTF